MADVGEKVGDASHLQCRYNDANTIFDLKRVEQDSIQDSIFVRSVYFVIGDLLCACVWYNTGIGASEYSVDR